MSNPVARPAAAFGRRCPAVRPAVGGTRALGHRARPRGARHRLPAPPEQGLGLGDDLVWSTARDIEGCLFPPLSWAQLWLFLPGAGGQVARPHSETEHGDLVSDTPRPEEATGWVTAGSRQPGSSGAAHSPRGPRPGRSYGGL